jgi:hypothetical protein
MSTVSSALAGGAAARALTGAIGRHAGITRRGLQIALGILWLIEGAVQAQPFMFTKGLATAVIAPAGQGQPGFPPTRCTGPWP